MTTANELADNLQEMWTGCYIRESAAMLRQRAAEIEQLREMNKDNEYAAQVAEELLHQKQAENQRLLNALSLAESSLSDYHSGAEWGAYDLIVLNAARAALGETK